MAASFARASDGPSIPRRSRRSASRVLSIFAAAGLALALLTPVSAASARTPVLAADEAEVPSGAVEIPYGETGEIRPGETWQFECPLDAPEDLAVVCAADSITLEVDDYDPDFGERVLRVTQRSGERSLTIAHRVRLAPPPAPEITTARIDVPLVVGGQNLIPLSMLGIVCELCTLEGGARLEIGILEEGQDAVIGVGATHLVARAEQAGDVVVPLRVTDDAGQRAEAELALSFVAPPTDSPPSALHAVVRADQEADVAEIDLRDAVWPGLPDDAIFVCPDPVPAGLSCAADGTATMPLAAGEPAQFAFRVVTADGGQSLGSVTVSRDEDAPPLAAPAWHDEFGFDLAYRPLDAEEAGQEAFLAALAALFAPLSPSTAQPEGTPGS